MFALTKAFAEGLDCEIFSFQTLKKFLKRQNSILKKNMSHYLLKII